MIVSLCVIGLDLVAFDPFAINEPSLASAGLFGGMVSNKSTNILHG